jgi:hypothetical protein
MDLAVDEYDKQVEKRDETDVLQHDLKEARLHQPHLT